MKRVIIARVPFGEFMKRGEKWISSAIMITSRGGGTT